MSDPVTPNILIMGLRGAGKSTLGRGLADRLSLGFIDLDDRTLEIMGAATVAHAWQAQGEPAFRTAEARALAEALERSGTVISLGGGTPTAPGCEWAIRDAIAEKRAIVIYLHSDADLLAERVRHDPPEHRPRLLGLDDGDARREMQLVYDQRDPLYRSLASHVIDATSEADDVLEAVIRAIE